MPPKNQLFRVRGKAIPDALVPAATCNILRSALAHCDLFVGGKVFGRDPGLPPNVPCPLEGLVHFVVGALFSGRRRGAGVLAAEEMF